MSNLRANSFVKKVLYQLKRLNGQTVDLYIRGTVGVNFQTGKMSYPETRYRMTKIPVLPIESMRQITASPPFATAGRQFEYGTFYATGTSSLLVKTSELPKNYTLNLDDSFIINHRRYKIKETNEFNEIQCVAFTIEELKGEPVYEANEIKQSIGLVSTPTQG